jgi:gliding motility-associated-like protein
MAFQNRSTGGEIYNWDFGDGAKEAKTDTSGIIHYYSQPGLYRIKLTAIDAGTCVGKDSTFVDVKVSEPSGLAGPDKTICFGELVQLEAGGGVLYDWRSEVDSVSSFVAQPVVSPEDTLAYFVSITDGNGCVVNDTVTVSVIPRVNLEFSYEKLSNCNDRPILKVTNDSETGDQIFFDFGDGSTSDLGVTTHEYAQDGMYKVSLVGVRESCVFEESVVLPFFYIKVPNVITPDGDGLNDTFKIKYGEQLISDVNVNVDLQVFNRWGGLVFEDKNYKDTWGAEDVAGGVYYYEVKIDNEITCKNWLQIIK